MQRVGTQQRLPRAVKPARLHLPQLVVLIQRQQLARGEGAAEGGGCEGRTDQGSNIC